jgi:Skp family chaperone for outer membrane proteins
MLAIDLYRATQKVTNLQQKLGSCLESERAKINQELLEARRELQLLRKMMDGEKETGASRNKYVTRNKFG